MLVGKTDTGLEAYLCTMDRKPAGWRAILGVIVAGLLLVGTPASAQKVPDPVPLEALIKVTLLSFNDANVTGNYTVLHAKLSKPFRDQFPPDRLKEVFKAFSDNHIDFDIIAAKPPIATEEPKVSDSGTLSVKGRFDTNPNVNYDLDFIMSDGEWKAIKINVRLGKPDGQ
jgi:hypothetical protein